MEKFIVTLKRNVNYFAKKTIIFYDPKYVLA